MSAADMSVMPSSVPEAGVSPVSIGAGQPRGGPTVLRMLLGIQLRRLREKANLTPDQAGYAIRASRSKISRVEHGRVGFKERDVTDLLSLYGVTESAERDRMLALARQANDQGWWAKYDDIMPDWFESYVGLEQATSLIRNFELQFVPGLFQTEDYARSVTVLGHRSAPSHEIEHRVSLRMQRQKILDLDDSPRIWAVIDESALRRPLGGVAAMRAQLRHLIEVTEYPRVTLQVMPFSRGGHPAAGGSFTVLRFAEPDLPDVVYVENLASALYLDKPTEVERYLLAMERLSIMAHDPQRTTEILDEIIKELEAARDE